MLIIYLKYYLILRTLDYKIQYLDNVSTPDNKIEDLAAWSDKYLTILKDDRY